MPKVTKKTKEEPKQGLTPLEQIENAKGLKKEVLIVLAAINAVDFIDEIQESVFKENGKKIDTIYATFKQDAIEVPDTAVKLGIKDSNELIIAAIHHFWSEGRLDVKTVKVEGKTFRTKKTTGIKTHVFNKGKKEQKVSIQFVKYTE